MLLNIFAVYFCSTLCHKYYFYKFFKKLKSFYTYILKVDRYQNYLYIYTVLIVKLSNLYYMKFIKLKIHLFFVTAQKINYFVNYLFFKYIKKMIIFIFLFSNQYLQVMVSMKHVVTVWKEFIVLFFINIFIKIIIFTKIHFS